MNRQPAKMTVSNKFLAGSIFISKKKIMGEIVNFMISYLTISFFYLMNYAYSTDLSYLVSESGYNCKLLWVHC
jgi:hypothetical protein